MIVNCVYMYVSLSLSLSLSLCIHIYIYTHILINVIVCVLLLCTSCDLLDGQRGEERVGRPQGAHDPSREEVLYHSTVKCVSIV